MQKNQTGKIHFLSAQKLIRPTFLMFVGLLAFMFGGAVVRGQTVKGEWTAEVKPNKPNLIQMTFQRRSENGGVNISSDYLALGELRGLAPGALAAAKTDVVFSIVREAGTFAFEGFFSGGRGVGFWTLTPNAKFVAALRSRGYDVLSDNDLTRAALNDLTTAFVDELKSAGYDKLTFNETMRAKNHDISAAYIREVKNMGFEAPPIEKLIRLRNHAITPEFVGEMRSAGFENLTIEQLIRLQNHGIKASFISDLKAEGYSGVTPEAAIRAKNHDIDRGFIRRAKAQGYNSVSLEELIRLSNRGVVK